MSEDQQSKLAHREFSFRSVDFVGTLFFVQATQVGVGIFSLPRIVVEEAGHNGWMAIPLLGLGIQVSLILMYKLLQRFESLDIYAILQRILGKWVGRSLGLLFAIYCAAMAALVSRSYIEVLQTWLFPTSHGTFFFFLLLIPCLYCATGGARVIARFAIMAALLTFWMVVLLYKPASEFQLVSFQPLNDVSVGGLLSATYKASLSAIGFELLLVIFPFIQPKKKALLASSIGIWFTTLLYLVVTVIAIGFMSEGQLKNMLTPTLYMFHFAQTPILERVEQIVIASWAFLVVNTASSYMWSAGRYVFALTPWKERTCILLFLPLMLAVGLAPRDVFAVHRLETYLSTVGGLVAVGVAPLLLLLAILLKKKGAGQGAGQTEASQQTKK